MNPVSFNDAMQKKYPEWIVLVVTADNKGRIDVMPAGWAMVASHNPPLFAVSVGIARYTHEVILDQREFVVAFPVPGMEEAVEYCGSCSGKEVEKLPNTNLKTRPASVVGAPLIEGCAVNLECKVECQAPAGDHTIFVGKVLAAYVEESQGKRLMNFGNGNFAAAEAV